MPGAGGADIDKAKGHNKDLGLHSEQEEKLVEAYEQKIGII